MPMSVVLYTPVQNILTKRDTVQELVKAIVQSRGFYLGEGPIPISVSVYVNKPLQFWVSISSHKYVMLKNIHSAIPSLLSFIKIQICNNKKV